MPDATKGTNEPKKSGGSKTCLIIASVIILGLGVLIGLYFGLAYFLRKADTGTSPNTGSTTKTSKGKLADQALVGTWESECLVPDLNSPWSEKHQFIIKADGSAVHTRWSNDSRSYDCVPNWQYGTATTDYQLTVPQTGQVDILYSGQTIYDIYKISGNTLEFGHGFQAHYSAGYDATQGNSESNRFHDLNTYIVYTKK